MGAKEFVSSFEAVVERHWTNRVLSPTQVMDTWESFVQSVEDGYDDNIYEYDNDLSVRNLIAKVIDDPSVTSHPESAWFLEATSKLDARLRAAMSASPIRRPDDDWWNSHLPLRAGPELAADFRRFYGYEAEVPG